MYICKMTVKQVKHCRGKPYESETYKNTLTNEGVLHYFHSHNQDWHNLKGSSIRFR